DDHAGLDVLLRARQQRAQVHVVGRVRRRGSAARDGGCGHHTFPTPGVYIEETTTLVCNSMHFTTPVQSTSALLIFTWPAVTFTSASCTDTAPLAVTSTLPEHFTVMPDGLIATFWLVVATVTLPPDASVSWQLTPPGVESLIVGEPVDSSTIAMRVPAR